jgi:hypothetical protein
MIFVVQHEEFEQKYFQAEVSSLKLQAYCPPFAAEFTPRFDVLHPYLFQRRLHALTHPL